MSRGVGRGNVVFLPPPRKSHFEENLQDADLENELLRFQSAVDTAKLQLVQLAAETDNENDHRVADIFSVHAMILESAFVEPVEALIRDKRVNSELALSQVLNDLFGRQHSLDDENFREKTLDIEDVATRLRRALRGTRAPLELSPNAVIVAREVRPSTVVELAKLNPAGLITEVGGWTSHMSIVAREFRLPMVTGIKNPEELFSPGDLVVVDGNEGEVILDIQAFGADIPTPAIVSTQMAGTNRAAAIQTKDGIEIVLRANAEDPSVYRAAHSLGARGVGLYRSELLVHDDGLIPDENSQAWAYTDMARATGSDGVCIRTFDISPEPTPNPSNARQGNPALGLRAIRSSIKDPDSFRQQIRAIVRASSAGKVAIILPMISNLEEIRQANELIISVTEEFPPANTPRVGVMIEIPSSVLMAAEIARMVDFVCLGTNDLVQYLLAVDRDNDAVADWYQTLNPAVIKALKMVIDAASSAGKPVIACGEMAGSPFYTPVLLGLGVRELSLNTTAILPIRNLLSAISAADAEQLVLSLSNSETTAEIESSLKQYYLKHWAHLFPERLLTSSFR